MRNSIKKVILAGGGTGGSVAPLLAVADSLNKDGNFKFLFIGTRKGVEAKMVREAGIAYKTILAGKFRRYFSWHNLLDILKIIVAFCQALFLIWRWHPDLVLSAGSFVAVPVVWAARLLRVKIIVHQMDVRLGLANKLMAPCADIITVTFEKSLRDYGLKAVWIGNPRPYFPKEVKKSKEEIKKIFELKNDLPVILVTGGGTGASSINKLVKNSLEELCDFCQIIHSTGKDKSIEANNKNYHGYELLSFKKMSLAISVADLIITRAGIGALTEISLSAKPAIIIPMSHSHQEENARHFFEYGAAVILEEKNLNKNIFVSEVRNLLKDEKARVSLARNVEKIMKKNATENMKKIIIEILNC